MPGCDNEIIVRFKKKCCLRCPRLVTTKNRRHITRTRQLVYKQAVIIKNRSYLQQLVFNSVDDSKTPMFNGSAQFGPLNNSDSCPSFMANVPQHYYDAWIFNMR